MLPILAALAIAVVPGERLDYSVRYGPVSIGTLTLMALEPETVGTAECWRFRADMELTRSFSWFFRADYRLETWCRVSDMLTLRSYKRTREPRYRAEWTAAYDTGQASVSYSDGQTLCIEPGSRDLLSTWYYFRALPLAPGDTVRTALHVDRRNYRLVAAVQETRSVRTPAGVFECVAVVPDAGGPFGTVYLTDDTLRIPVSIRTRVGGLVAVALLRSVSREEEW